MRPLFKKPIAEMKTYKIKADVSGLPEHCYVRAMKPLEAIKLAREYWKGKQLIPTNILILEENK
jgi:hypothetical protein